MNWNQLKWANEEAVWGLLVLLIFALLGWWTKRWHEQTLDEVGVGTAFQHQIRRSPLWSRRLRAGVFVLGWCALIIALMQPRYGLREARVSNIGIDIAVVLDVSKSMSVADVVPNRLEASKIEIGDILRGLRGGRVALIPFSGIPFVQCPLTSDTDVIRTYLQELRLEDMPRGGTNLGRALNLAHQVLTGEDATVGEGGKVTTQYQGSRNKAILLLSDGENHEGAPEEFIETMKASNIRIFSVGIGSASGTLVPKFNPDGTSIGFLQDESGTPVISSLNEILLRALAEKTGGAYFHYADRSIAQPLLSEIDRLEKQEVEERFMKLGEERFQWPLFVGFLLLTFATLLQRIPLSGAASLVLALVVGTPGESLSQPTGLTVPPDWTYTEQEDVERGKIAIESENAEEAQRALNNASQRLPESAALHYNKGLAHLLAGKLMEAKDAFERALSMERGPLLARQNLGLGIALARRAMELEKSENETEKVEAPETWESAISAFETAVLNGAGENAAWNLEVALIGKCRSSNDPFEPNNSRETAASLEIVANPEAGQGEGAASVTLCMGDDDWFFVPFGEGDRIEVELSHGGKGVKEEAALDLYFEEGPSLETLGWREGQEQTWKFHNLGNAGGVFLHIYSRDEGDHQLDLAVTVRPPCRTRDDALEDNDRLTQASPPPGPETNLHICENDEDWFQVNLAEGESLFGVASAEGEWTEGFQLEIVDPFGRPMTSTAGYENTQMALLLDPPPGPVFARIRGGEDIDAPYQLQLHHVPPCPDGNDPLEPNNRPDDARSLADLGNTPTNEGGAMPRLPMQPGVLPGGSPGQRNSGQPIPVPMPGAFPPGPSTPAMPPGVMPPSEAAASGPQSALLRICSGDEDWISISVPADTQQVATILFDHSKGNLRLSLWNADGTEELSVVDTSTSQQNAEVLAVPKAEEEQTFLLRIDGIEGAENFYVLRLDAPQGQPDSSDSSEDSDSNDEEQEQDNSSEDQKEEETEQEEKENDPMEQAIEQLDRNDSNLEAEEAARQNPFAGPPKKDW